MKRAFVHNGLIAGLLVLMAVTAFSNRLESFRRTKRFTVDEAIYCMLAVQLKDHFPAYHVIPYAERLQEERRDPLPAYLFQPLFKHPPLFPLLVSLSMRLFGENDQSAVYVSLLFGVLMIPLVYFLGKEFFGKEIGLTSAFFVWLDPVHIMCSQKIWTDTTLSFWTVLALYCYVKGKKTAKDNWFVLSGIVLGLALLTKYSAVLLPACLAAYEWVRPAEQRLSSRRMVRYFVAIPFLMISPWVYWNLKVYGIGVFSEIFGRNGHLILSSSRRALLAVILSAALAWFGLKKIASRRIAQQEAPAPFPPGCQNQQCLWISKALRIVFLVVFFGKLGVNIIDSLSLTTMPYTTWQPGHFQRPLFYFEQLSEYSFLYVLAFLSFFIPGKRRTGRAEILPIFVGVYLGFFLFWGSYQSRYILPIMPVMIILALEFLREIMEALKDDRCGGLFQRIAVAGGVLILLDVFLRTNYVNFLVSSTNDMCYF